MFGLSLPTAPADYAAIQIHDAIVPQPGLLLCDPPSQYHPRHPAQTEFYRLFEDHFDSQTPPAKQAAE